MMDGLDDSHTGKASCIARDELTRVSAFSTSIADAAKECTTVGQVLELLAKNAPQVNAQVLLQELVLRASNNLLHVDSDNRLYKVRVS